MGGEKADMVFTDPPYGLNWNTDYTRFKVWANNNRKFNHIQNDDKPFDPNRFLEQYKNCLFFGANCFSDKLPLGNWIVWDKRFESGKAWLADGEVAWYTGSGAVYIISETNQGFVCSDKEKYHPTQKPIKLIEKIFEKIKCQNFIFDPFGGSGTTLIACEKTNRRCFMVEIDPSYVDVIISRWEQFTGQTAVKL
jgi:site-specific DNA-methyltransferase (adenine-specific)